MVAAELAMTNALAGDPAQGTEELKRPRDFQQKLPDALAECGLRHLWAVTRPVPRDRDAALAELRIAVGQLRTFQIVESITHLPEAGFVLGEKRNAAVGRPCPEVSSCQ